MKTESTPPRSEAELLARVHALAGMRLGELAAYYDVPVPLQQTHAKGWVGVLLERCLGATAASRPEPDFQHISVELKTLPLLAQTTPKESTYVCHAPLLTLSQQRWHTSTVYRKLARVLWVPVESDTPIPLAQRRIGYAWLWSPSPQQEAVLRQDWETLTEMLCLGQLAYIKAQQGTYLQLRPKAANAKSLCWGIGEDGQRVRTLPRGFYLRTTFTRAILSEW